VPGNRLGERPPGRGAEHQPVRPRPSADLFGEGFEHGIIGGDVALRGRRLHRAHVATRSGLLAYPHGPSQEVDVLHTEAAGFADPQTEPDQRDHQQAVQLGCCRKRILTNTDDETIRGTLPAQL